MTKFFILRRALAQVSNPAGRALTLDELDAEAELPDRDGTLSGVGVEVAAEEVWVQIGEQEAKDRDQALRLFLGEPVREIDDTFCAVSENAWKPRRVTIKPSIKIREA